MRIAASILWIGLAVGFVWLGRTLASDATAQLEPYEPKSPHMELAGQGFHIDLDVAGTPLDEPFAKQRAEMESYVDSLRSAYLQRGQRAALLCYGAAGASLLGLGLTWVGARAARGAP